ncbi:unnamed protein product, partial [Prorocentrum cordatum]
PVVHCDCPAVEPTQYKEVFHERANPVEQTGLVLATFLTGLVAGHQLARGGLFGCQRRAPPAPVVSALVPALEAAAQAEEEDIAELARRQQALIRKRGEFFAMRYNVGGRELWHTRICCGTPPNYLVGVTSMTPDLDEYEERRLLEGAWRVSLLRWARLQPRQLGEVLLEEPLLPPRREALGVGVERRQAAALRNIETAYLSVPPPPGDPTFRKGALDALFAGPGYVDNFMILGSDRKAVQSGLDSVCRRLESLGLSVHELSAASQDISFVGVSFSEGSRVSIKPSNLWRLRYGIEALLRRGVCSGSALQIVMGHVTWAALLRREVLSLFNASHQFMHAVGERPQKLWPRVRQELWTFRSILPLLFTQINIPWHNVIAASDASLFGIGVCTRVVSPEQSGEIDALRGSTPVEGIEDFQQFLEVSGALFEEVPEDVLSPPAWPRTTRRIQTMAPKGLPARRPRQRAKPTSRAGVLKAQRAASASRLTAARAPVGNLSLLESLAVAPGTEVLYVGIATHFLQYCQGMGADWQSAGELDPLLVAFFNALFLEGASVEDGSKLLASLSHFIPDLYKSTAAKLPRASRCLVAWRRRVPPRMRLPLPRAAALALAGCLRHLGFPRMCLWVVITFVACLRPHEAFLLRGKHLVAPKVVAGRQYSSWGLLLHDASLGDPGKTGMFDAAVLLDRCVWLLPCLEALKHQSLEDGSLWDFSPADLQKQFTMLVKILGLEALSPHLYSLRHGGASDDLATAVRTQEEVKVRGRWATITSLKRYGKTTRLLLEMATVPEDVFELGRAVEANFASAMAEGFDSAQSPVRLPPRIAALLGPGRGAAGEFLEPEVRRYLQRAFRACAVPRPRFMKHLVFLELFAGSGRIAAAIQKLGYRALSFDLLNNPRDDHLDPTFQKVIVGWLTSGCIAALWLGTPCTTWARALRRPLRSSADPLGVHDLSEFELERLRIGNATFFFSVMLIRLRIASNIPVFPENPRTSIMWWTEHMKDLM